jgi:hypothetical protein
MWGDDYTMCGSDLEPLCHLPALRHLKLEGYWGSEDTLEWWVQEARGWPPGVKLSTHTRSCNCRPCFDYWEQSIGFQATV